MKPLSRAEFLRIMGAASVGAAVFGAQGALEPGGAFGATREEQSEPTAEALDALGSSLPYLTVAHGKNVAAITRKAIAGLGGMSRFVKPGQTVVIKPNICTARAPKFAATTNPTVVATLVSLCRAAGARSVHVMDYPINSSAASAYHASGIGAAVAKAGGKMVTMSPTNWASYRIPKGRWLSSWRFYREAIAANVLIDVPILKQHGSSVLTIGGKNLMGLIENRGSLHNDLSQGIADITSLLKPDLTVVDAVRILVSNGPTGGSLSDVRVKDIVLASHDVVAADAYAATRVFGLKKASRVPYIASMAKMGLGKIDLSKVKIAKYNL
jgi:uncharacterized protein (DUF362 family)